MSKWQNCIHVDANMDGVYCKDGHGDHYGRCWAYNGVQCPSYEDKIPTNADHIRSMTDEQLAEFLVRLAFCSDMECDGCPFEDNGTECWTAEGIENWLKQPYKEKET